VPGRITAPRTLDLEDFGAHAGEHLGAIRSGYAVREVKDGDVR